MTAYEPPEFQFSGLIFNPLIYEQGEATTSSNVFTDLTTDTLYTNNIQGKTAAAATSLYTLSSGIITIGGSLLTAIYSLTDVYYYYNALQTQLMGTRFNFYATDMISTDYYADIAGSALSTSIRVQPQFTGDTTFCNGRYSIQSGTTRLLNLISTSLEAPIHYLYNVAGTMKKQTNFNADNITEIYHCDALDPTIPTATMQVKDAGFAGSNSGDITITDGRFNVNSSFNNILTSPSNVMYGANFNVNEGATSNLRRNYGFATDNVYEIVRADSTRIIPTTGRIDWTISPTTPTISNTGVYKLTAGDFETTAPISPLYTPVAYTGTPTGCIGNSFYTSTLNTGTFARNALTTCGSFTIPAGVYVASGSINIKCLLNNTLVYAQVGIGTATGFFAINGSHNSGNPAVNRDLWYSISAVFAVSASTTVNLTILMDFNVVNAYTRNNSFTSYTITRIA
jgi:hypothetical protein